MAAMAGCGAFASMDQFGLISATIQRQHLDLGDLHIAIGNKSTRKQNEVAYVDLMLEWVVVQSLVQSTGVCSQ